MDNKLYQKMKDCFYETFETKIKPKLAPFEKERKIKFYWLIIYNLVILTGLITLCVKFLSLYFNSVYHYQFLIIVFLGIFMPSSFIALFAESRMRKKQFEIKIKQTIMPLISSCYGNLKWYSPHEINCCQLYDAEKTIEKVCLIPWFSCLSAIIGYDDMFSVCHNGVYLEIIETRVKSLKNNRCFNGVIVICNLNKSFKGHTLIYPNTIQHKSPLNYLKPTVLEDVNFEKKFDVFTNDEIEARYLITPSFMERLNNIQTAFLADKIYCAFYKEYFYLALSSKKDLFSIGNFNKPIDNIELYYPIHNEIVSIIKLIDHFKLNENTGL